MTFMAKVWSDTLSRLRQDMPGFAYDAWIAPLEAKSASGCLVIGCPTSFHRDRILRHHLPALERALEEVFSEARTSASQAPRIEVVTTAEFARTEGMRLEVRVEMRRVAATNQALAANALHQTHPNARIQPVPGSPARTETWRDADPAGRRDRPTPRPLRAVPGPVTRKTTTTVRNDANPQATGERVQTHPLPLPDLPEPNRPEFGLNGNARRRTQPSHTFERFVAGPCNALAREAALALAYQRQASLNLLYVAGPSGMGKSHLARATAEEARGQLSGPNGRGGLAHAASAQQARGADRVIYTTAEQFTSEFVSAVRNGRNEAWVRQYRRRIDLIVFEDIQLLSGRAKTQQELFNTLSHVIDSGGRVMLTGDRAPRDLKDLDPRLRALAGRGFIAELHRPDAIVRRHLFREKAAAAGVSLPDDCLEILVEATESSALGSSILELESLLVQVVMSASLAHRKIDAELVREAIALKSGSTATRPPRQLEVTEIVRTVAGFFGLRPEALATRSRRRDVLVPRQLAMYLAHRYTDASFTEIGRALGRDHPSVKNAIRKIEDQTLRNASLRYQVEALSERIDGMLTPTVASR
jgi:chromosomal replication initiator protein